MSSRKIFIRFAQASDIERLTKEGVITGAPPPNESWNQRIVKWLTEQKAGRRVILIAEDDSGLLATVQLVFKFPLGYSDPEAANGIDVAMMEGLRMRADARNEIGSELVGEVQALARKRNVRTLTFCLPMNQQKALHQAKLWGFEEFRIMAEPNRTVAFFRKSID